MGWGSDEDDEEEEEYEEEEETLNESEQEIILFEDKHDTDDNVITEINHLKSMLEKAHSDKHASEQKVHLLQEEVDGLKAQMLKLQQEASTPQPSSSSSTENEEIHHLLAQLKESQASQCTAEAKVERLTMELASCQEENQQTSQFTQTLQDEMAKLTLQHDEAMASSQSTMNAMKAELESSQTETNDAQQIILQLQQELKECQEEVKTQRLNFAKTLEDQVAMVRAEHQKGLMASASAQEGSSLSSAVEIPPVHDEEEQEIETKVGEEEEDGWGDSWSDDD